MSTIADILCKNCDHRFEVYWNTLKTTSEPVVCPHCKTEMAEHMAQQTLDTLGRVNDLNYHFRKYESESGDPVFVVGFREYDIPASKYGQ